MNAQDQTIATGGTQYITQIVYLDFDGELTKYRNQDLNLDIDVTVEDSRLSQDRIRQITDSLNEQYASQNVRFVTERPEDTDYSTIYVGKTSSFSQYGTFAGLAEAIDSGNQNKSDNAFVILDSTSDNAQIISAISHELDHLLGTLDHGGEGLERYASRTRYDVSSGVTSTGVILDYDSMYVHSGGTASSTTVNSGGSLYVSSGGTALSIVENGGYVSFDDNAVVTFASNSFSGLILSHGTAIIHSGTTANDTINSGQLYISSGGIANSTTVGWPGFLYVSDGGIANNTTVNRGFLYVSEGGVANDVTVCSGGTMSVSSGGTALNVVNSGYIGGVVICGDTATVLKGINADGKSFYISNGTANNVSGSLEISSGGIAKNTTVVSGGTLCIRSGGSISGENKVYGKLVASAPIDASDTSLNLFLSKDCSSCGYVYYADNLSNVSISIVVNNDQSTGWCYFASVKSSYAKDFSGTISLKNTNGNKIGDFIIKNGSSTNVISSDGKYYTVKYDLYSDGLYLSITDKPQIISGVCPAGTITSGMAYRGDYISVSGTLTDSEIQGIRTLGGGVAYVAVGSQGKVSSTSFSCACMLLHSGASAYDLDINSFVGIRVESGAYISGVKCNNSGAYGRGFGFASGGVALDVVTTSGYGFDVRVEGSDSQTKLTGSDTCYGSFYISNGVASNFALIGKAFATVTEGPTGNVGQMTPGTLTVASGGIAYDTKILTSGSEYGILCIASGGTAVRTSVCGEGVATPVLGIGSGGIAIGTTVGSNRMIGVGDFNKSGHDGLLWLEKSTGYVYMQYDMTSLAEITGKANCLGALGDGYSLKGAGDFTGNGIAGALLQGPAFGDPEISLNYGLPVWARENDGATFNGWLGALVNTWQEGDPLRGDLTDPASINANNYQYAIVGVGDFNGDGVDDVMLQNTMPKAVTEKGVDYPITGSGDVFTFLTGDKAAIIAGASPTVCYTGCATDGWEVLGFGDFNADGIDDALLSDGTGLAGWQMTNGQRAGDFWFGNLDADGEFAGIADFNNDGTDDILVRDTATESLTAWTVKDGTVTGYITLKA